MRHRITRRFRRCFSRLPPDIQRRARSAVHLLKTSPENPGLRLKAIHGSDSIYSARVSRDYRALAYRENDLNVWFWIGSHDQYEKIISDL